VGRLKWDIVCVRVRVRVRVCVCVYRMHHKNPEKSNNFSKQNFINEKIEYYKKFFHVVGSYRV